MREIGSVRFRFMGDQHAAQGYTGIARTQLGILKNLMSFNKLQQLSRTVTLADGTSIFVQSVFGQDTVRINVPPSVASSSFEQAIKKPQKIADYVPVMMPNPIPYRGVSIGENPVFYSNTPSSGTTYAMASDGTILASEAGTQTGTVGLSEIKYSSLVVSYGQSAIYSGGSSVWMFDVNYAPGHNSTVFNHKLTFTVPEDCIYPVPSATASYLGTDGLSASWAADWSAGVAAFNARRLAWNKKNSDELIAALKGGFQPGAAGVTRPELQTGKLPASWDGILKTPNVFTYINNTHQPIPFSASYADVVTSDTSANLTQAGTKLTTRTATFSYTSAPQLASLIITPAAGITYTTASAGTDAQGNALVTVTYTQIVVGTLTQVLTHPYLTGYPGNYIDQFEQTYLNWYDDGNGAGNDEAGYFVGPMTAQFCQYSSPTTSLGCLWSGVVVTGQNYNNTAISDSTWGNPTAGFVNSAYTPELQPYSSTLVSTAAALYLQYHNTVPPVYDSTVATNTNWNDGALYKVTQIELGLFGPVKADGTQLGIFADPTDADGCTSIAYYGEASFQFDWFTGALTFMGWSPRKDANGNDAPTILPLPSGVYYDNSSGALRFSGMAAYPYGLSVYNCSIGYVWNQPSDLWPVVNQYLLAKIATLRAGGGDQVLLTIIKQANGLN